MRPVNLLPERNRPRAPTGEQKGSAYFLLGGLAVVLAAAVFYVLTINSINSSRDKIATANAQAARDNALANQLTPYGDFQKIKTQRVASVMQLAKSRFDWERLVRELSLVLPQGVWLTNASASSSGNATPGGSRAPAPSAGATSAAGASPSVLVDGCAANQSQVAVTLVRLRELQGASDVQLSQSSKPSGGSGSSSAGSGSSGGCGTTNNQPNYSFEATVTFNTQKENTTAPPWLGGGS
jgi:hypothetical protein